MKTEKLTIFVVDDSSVALETIKSSLQQSLNCRIETFASAEECIQRSNEHPPDLILSDYYLDALNEHKMNGDQMLARIKVKHPTIPVIMYSSHNTVDVVMRLMKLGAANFIPKEKNFMKAIRAITLKQIQQIKLNYETRMNVRFFLLFLAIVTSIWFIIGLYSPGLLAYYFCLIVIVSIFWASLGKKKEEGTSKQ